MTTTVLLLMLSGLACLACWGMEAISDHYPVIVTVSGQVDTMPGWAAALRWILLCVVICVGLLVCAALGVLGIVAAFGYIGARAVFLRRWVWWQWVGWMVLVVGAWGVLG